ncbi:hypothetical protein BBJ28_00010507 [Nothophytophthora sp. Chile5]|nr:hypothetical protein BBJ28_00010507 [Nothophytophthora sp. Chile5]
MTMRITLQIAISMELIGQQHGEVLRDFNYSVRVNLANSALCGDRQRSVVLKLRLAKPDGSERQVVLELDDAQLARVLADFARIHQVNGIPLLGERCRKIQRIPKQTDRHFF